MASLRSGLIDLLSLSAVDEMADTRPSCRPSDEGFYSVMVSAGDIWSLDPAAERSGT